MSKLVRFTWICTKMGDSQARELIHNLICLLKVKMNLSSQELYYTKPQLSSVDCLFQITIIIIYDILSLYKYVLSAYHAPGTILSNYLILTHLIFLKTFWDRASIGYFLVNIAKDILCI